MTDNNVIISPAQVGWVQLIDRSTNQVYDPTRWKLTTKDGTVYILDDTKGIESVTDTNGNTLTYTADGIQSSDSRKVTIERDLLDRVTAVTDFNGGQFTYQYDAYGDLISATDRLGNITHYSYDDNHILTEVHDPLGRLGFVTSTMTTAGSQGTSVPTELESSTTTIYRDGPSRCRTASGT